MKINFLAKIYLAITDFRFYPFVVQKEKFIKAFSYFLGLIMLVSLCLTFKYMPIVLEFTQQISTIMSNENISDFTISNGQLDMVQNIDVSQNGIHIYSNDEIELNEEDLKSHVNDKDSLAIFMYKDVTAIGTEDIGFVLMEYEDVGKSFSKQDMINIMNTLNSQKLAKAYLGFMIFGVVFLAYFMMKIFNIFEITFLMFVLGMLIKVKYKFTEYMKAAFYVVTLPIIVETISFMMIGTVNNYAYIAYQLLSFVYMYYVVRALKLTDVILVAQEKMFGIKKENDNENETQNSMSNDVKNEEENKESEDEEKKDQDK